MASPICTVNGASTINGVSVAKNTTVTISLADTAGVKLWTIKCFSTDENQNAASITAGLTVDVVTKTATFTSPNVSDGAAMLFDSTVNGKLDANGRVDESLTTRFGIYVETDTGTLRVGAFDETMEGSAAYGWTAKMNAGIRAAATAGSTPTINGTLPIVVTGPSTARVVSINPATTLLPGSMSASDKTKLDASTSNDTASTIMMRSASNQVDVSQLNANRIQGIANLLLSADGFGDITLDGASSGELLVPMAIQTTDVKLISAITGVVRSLPLNWTSPLITVGLVKLPGWAATSTATTMQNVVDALAECYVQVNLPHGVQVTNVYFKTKGAGAGPVPGNPPTYSFVRQHTGTLAQTIIGTATDAGGATYRSTSHTTIVTCAGPTNNIINRATYRYYMLVTPETGSDSVVGLQLDSVTVELTFPVGFSVLAGLG